MPDNQRRTFLWQSAAVGGALLLPITVLEAAQTKEDKEEEREVTPNEDLMREHGLLRRILLIYDECVAQLNQKNAKRGVDAQVVVQSADIVRNFVEDYHEMLEQQQVFPRLQKARKLTRLVDVLIEQHRVGRMLTDRIKQAASGGFKTQDNIQTAVKSIRSFQHMYRAHAAFEDTVLFPEFKTIVSPSEYNSLGEDFEKIETQKFGQEGFEHVLAKVAGLEEKLGIHQLSRYTPKV